MRTLAASFPLIVAVWCTGCGGSGSSPTGNANRRAEDVIAAALQQSLNENRQMIFNGFHPVGTAKSVTVHDVVITWKHGQPTNRLNDVQAYNARFTMYWEGPITKDGFTKISATFDAESQRWMAPQILATNGMTNQQAGEALMQFGGAALSTYLNDGNN